MKLEEDLRIIKIYESVVKDLKQLQEQESTKLSSVYLGTPEELMEAKHGKRK